MNYKPEIILVDEIAENLPVTQKILSQFKDVDRTTIYDLKAIKRPADFSESKKMMLITANQGTAFKPCQGIGPGHLCCNYWIIDLISNCPMNCSYCVLQYYLKNNPLLTVYANIDEILTKASLYIASHRNKKFRIGTGELSDSLAIDHITGFSTKLIEYFSNYKNVLLELKTKTDNVGHLLKLDHKGRTVLSWSVNPQSIIDAEEEGAASLEERFLAADKAIKAGYKVAFHFDPIIYSENWEELYKEVTTEIVQRFPHDKISWISIGTLRFPTDMREIVMKRFPKSKIFYNELLPVNGRVRYFRPIREEVYRKMFEFLAPLKEKCSVYLCMETKTVWQNVNPEIGQSNKTIADHVCKCIPTHTPNY